MQMLVVHDAKQTTAATSTSTWSVISQQANVVLSLLAFGLRCCESETSLSYNIAFHSGHT
jgi:hypothetical protein